MILSNGDNGGFVLILSCLVARSLVVAGENTGSGDAHSRSCRLFKSRQLLLKYVVRLVIAFTPLILPLFCRHCLCFHKNIL
jgi:hypothetical protein